MLASSVVGGAEHRAARAGCRATQWRATALGAAIREGAACGAGVLRDARQPQCLGQKGRTGAIRQAAEARAGCAESRIPGGSHFDVNGPGALVEPDLYEGVDSARELGVRGARRECR